MKKLITAMTIVTAMFVGSASALEHSDKKIGDWKHLGFKEMDNYWSIAGSTSDTGIRLNILGRLGTTKDKRITQTIQMGSSSYCNDNSSYEATTLVEQTPAIIVVDNDRTEAQKINVTIKCIGVSDIMHVTPKGESDMYWLNKALSSSKKEVKIIIKELDNFKNDGYSVINTFKTEKYNEVVELIHVGTKQLDASIKNRSNK